MYIPDCLHPCAHFCYVFTHNRLLACVLKPTFFERESCSLTPSSFNSRVYCSDECESLDSASPSLSSATSSAYPSPYLDGMKTGNLDVPALIPSVLGHRPQHSISSSSSGWSALTDEEEGDPYVYVSSDYQSEMISLDVPSSKPSSHLHSKLSYARRPSTTNHRSMVPLLLRHNSSMTLSSGSSFGVPRSMPSPFYAATEDDCSSIYPSKDLPEDSSKREGTPGAARRKRNQASLPAYFSLLQGTTPSTGAASPSSSPRLPRRVPSVLQTLSRSMHTSPTTLKVSHAAVVLTTAEAHIERSAPRERGRQCECDPDARSASSRRLVARSPPRHLSQPALSAVHRARIDSVEKVTEWVSSSPVVGHHHSRKHTITVLEGTARRNSSPPPQPKYEFVDALTRGLRGCAIADDDEDEEEDGVEEIMEGRRGRRMVGELDEPMWEEAPGFGSGRSGLRARERGRAGVVRALALH